MQPSHETLLARAPDVILEVRAEGLIAPREVAGERGVWSALSSLPAVRNGRVHFLSASTWSCRARGFARRRTEALARDASSRGVRQPFKMKILLSWSSGKDSAWALHVLNRQHPGAVAALLTTVNEAMDRVAMHGVRREVLEAQARAAGCRCASSTFRTPARTRSTRSGCGAAVAAAVADGFTHVAFGDLFLEDVRRYREERLAGSGLDAAVSAVGHPDARRSPREMIAGGLRARLACVDTRVLDASFVGREFDAALLDDLPPHVDPCGENGEFHTCVYAGPMFTQPLRSRTGETVDPRAVLWADLTPRVLSGERA